MELVLFMALLSKAANEKTNGAVRAINKPRRRPPWVHGGPALSSWPSHCSRRKIHPHTCSPPCTTGHSFEEHRTENLWQYMESRTLPRCRNPENTSQSGMGTLHHNLGNTTQEQKFLGCPNFLF